MVQGKDREGVERMKRRWEIDEAVAAVKKGGAEVTDKRILHNGLNGLKACSAYDYLTRYCGYKP